MAGECEVALHHGYWDYGGLNAVEFARVRPNPGESRVVAFIAALFLVVAIAATAFIGWFTAAGPQARQSGAMAAAFCFAV